MFGGSIVLTKAIKDLLWVFKQNFVASTTSSGDRLGEENAVAVSYDGLTAVIGAPYDDIPVFSIGSAYVFTNTNDTWTEVQKLTPTDLATYKSFGSSVSISADGKVIAVGARYDDQGNSDAGAVYIFRHNGSTWVQEQKISYTVGFSHFGAATALSGDGKVLHIGAYRSGAVANQAGLAFTYVYDDYLGTWVLDSTLQPADLAASDNFGYSIATNYNGSVVAVGSYLEDGAGGDIINGGAVYVFEASSYSVVSELFSNWVETAKVQPVDANLGYTVLTSNDQFGHSVDMTHSGNTIVAGALYGDGGAQGTGRVYVIERNPETGLWNTTASIDSPSAVAEGNDFGYSVNVSSNGDTIVVGEPGFYINPNDQVGRVYVFTLCDNAWIEEEEFGVSDGSVGTFFGQGKDLGGGRGDTLLIGASYGGPTDGGQVDFHKRVGRHYAEREILPPTSTQFTSFGYSTDISKDGLRAVVGEPFYSGSNGRCHFFARQDKCSEDLDKEWTHQLLDTGINSERLGSSISMSESGDTVVVGAEYAPGNSSETRAGRVYVYYFHSFPDSFSTTQINAISDPSLGTVQQADERFGHRVKLSNDGTAIIVGNDNVTTSNGRAFVFTHPNESAVSFSTGYLLDSKVYTDNYGEAVGINGDGTVAVVGALSDDTVQNGSGAVYIYRFNGSTYVEEQKIKAGAPTVGGGFGWAVDVSANGQRIVVGAISEGQHGAAYVFKYDDYLGMWVEEARLAAPDDLSGSPLFGYSVSISDDGLKIAVSAIDGQDYDKTNSPGAVYQFNYYEGVNYYDETGWVLDKKIIQNEATISNGDFGRDVSIRGAGPNVELIAGASSQDGRGVSDSGAAYSFNITNFVPYHYAVLNDNPFLYWRLADFGATATDETTNGITGTYTNNPLQQQPGLIVNDTDECVQLSSIDPEYIIGNIGTFDTQSNFTMECLFQLNGALATSRILHLSDVPGTALHRFGIIVLSTGQLGVMLGSSGNYGSTYPITTGVPYHVAVTYKYVSTGPTEYQVFLNGDFLRSGVSYSPTNWNAASTIIAGAGMGTTTSTIQQGVTGFVDEVAFYKHRLTRRQIKGHYEAAIGSQGYL